MLTATKSESIKFDVEYDARCGAKACASCGYDGCPCEACCGAGEVETIRGDVVLSTRPCPVCCGEDTDGNEYHDTDREFVEAA